jgi:exodeoxyribonuclease VII small subunit
MDTPTDEPTNDLSFEDALKRLEAIVHQLESGEAKLDDAIKLYEEGTRLRQQCSARLDAAQARIEAIRLDAGGGAAGVAPFDGG